MRTFTYYCFPFGMPMDGIYITTRSKFTARDLAAYRLRIPRHLIDVRREPEPAPAGIKVYF